jgi:hypothetical protein
MKMEIKIDDYTFAINGKYVLRGKYDIVKITNVESKYTFYVYRSNSELGIFRFGCYGFGNIYKGTNYVTTTNIHHLLQTYILSIYDDIQEIEEENLPYFYNTLKNGDININIISDNVKDQIHANYPENMLQEELSLNIKGDDQLKIINVIESRYYLKDNSKYFNFLGKYSKCGSMISSMAQYFLPSIYNTYELLHDNKNVLDIYKIDNEDILEYLKTELNKLIVNINNEILTFLDELKIYNEFINQSQNIETNNGHGQYQLIKDITNLLRKKSIKLDKITKFKIVKLYVKFVSDYFEHILIVKDSNSKINILSKETLTLKKFDNLQFYIETYVIKTNYKFDIDDGLLFYCYRFKITNLNKSDLNKSDLYDKTHHLIINAVPIKSKINVFGLYNSFIDIGQYLCKPYDYLSEGIGSIIDDYDNKHRKNGEYAFIGDILDGQFPTMEYKNSIFDQSEIEDLSIDYLDENKYSIIEDNEYIEEHIMEDIEDPLPLIQNLDPLLFYYLKETDNIRYSEILEKILIDYRYFLETKKSNIFTNDELMFIDLEDCKNIKKKYKDNKDDKDDLSLKFIYSLFIKFNKIYNVTFNIYNIEEYEVLLCLIINNTQLNKIYNPINIAFLTDDMTNEMCKFNILLHINNNNKIIEKIYDIIKKDSFPYFFGIPHSTSIYEIILIACIHDKEMLKNKCDEYKSKYRQCLDLEIMNYINDIYTKDYNIYELNGGFNDNQLINNIYNNIINYQIPYENIREYTFKYMGL